MNYRAWIIFALATALAAEGCASILGIEDVPDGATSPSDASQHDVKDAGGPKCDPYAAFGAPTTVPFAYGTFPNSTPIYLDMSPDEQTLFVTLPLPQGNYDIAQAVRNSNNPPTTPFAASYALVPSANNINAASVSADDLTLIWGNPSDAGTHLRRSTQPSPQAQFTSIGYALGALYMDGGSEIMPFLLPDNSKLFFVRVSNNNTQVTITEANTDAGFTDSKPVAGLPAYAVRPVLSPDALTLYFNVSTNISVATRATTSDAFGNIATAVTITNGSQLLYPVHISSDLCTLYYQRLTTTFGDGGEVDLLDLLVATKQP